MNLPHCGEYKLYLTFAFFDTIGNTIGATAFFDTIGDTIGDAIGAMCRNTQVGVTCNRACSACYTHMSLLFQAAAFVLPPRSATRRSAAGSHHRGQGETQGQGSGRAGEKALVLGEPLPDLGTCKHYHHSHRWDYALHVVFYHVRSSASAALLG